MEEPSGVDYPPVTLSEGAADQLVLARLHDEPIAFLHLREPPGHADLGALIDAVWRDAKDEIIRHARSYGCLGAPGNEAELSASLGRAGGDCPGKAPPRPRGSAAVILCTIGREAMLARSLHSLSHMHCSDYEIIVVDNAPSSRTREIVEAAASPVPVRYVVEPRPGLAVARNTGVAAATDADYVAFTDDDVLVDERWLAWLLAPFSQEPVQAVTGLVMPLDLGSEAQKRFERYAGFGKGIRAATYDNFEHRARERFLYPYWGGMFGSGNSMAFRREALLAIGGFDPALGAGTPTAGGEDLAAFSDVILAGGCIHYEPRSVCWHEHRSDEAALRTQVRNYGIGLTAVLWRYFRKDWRFTFTALRSLPLMARLARSRSADRDNAGLPGDLARLELRGRLLGPWRYEISRRRAKRGSAEKELGRPRRAGPTNGQAGDQTRT